MKKRSLIFWDLLAKRYSKQPIADEETYQKKLEITRGYFHSDAEVFEFGCGTGSTAIAHAPHVKHILATDGSAKMIKIAENKASAENIKNITFETSTIDSLTVPNQTFDIVLGLSILHLLKNKEEVIAKVYDILKPGGVFISSTTCLENPSVFVRLLAKAGRLFGLTLQLFTSNELKSSLMSAGFEIDYEWQPNDDKTKAVFIVAKKTE